MVQALSEDLAVNDTIDGTKMPRNNPAIVVMAKIPRPGHVKTRLRPILSDVQCAELSKCFLLDSVAKADKISPNVIIAFTPDDGKDEVRDLVSGKQSYIPQIGSELGERLESAIAGADNHGFGPVVVIGTDSPTLPASYVQSAVEHLTANANGVAIGPTDDGGYYLIGMSRLQKGLFSGISWSTGRVFEQTISNAKEIPGVNILELPRWYDVDEPADLVRLNAELDYEHDARTRAPETFRWVVSHRKLLRSAAKVSLSSSDTAG